MRPQHGETLGRLRGRVTSLANRAARRSPDIQSRLGVRGDCTREFPIAIAHSLPRQRAAIAQAWRTRDRRRNRSRSPRRSSAVEVKRRPRKGRARSSARLCTWPTKSPVVHPVRATTNILTQRPDRRDRERGGKFLSRGDHFPRRESRLGRKERDSKPVEAERSHRERKRDTCERSRESATAVRPAGMRAAVLK